MKLDLLFDTGNLILIWLVQLVIYPSFRYSTTKKLKAWHPIYTKRVSIIVVPLMFGQLISSTMLVIESMTLISVLKIILIVVVWILTFCIFVPLHQQIEKNNSTETTVEKLTQKNWSRTVIWTVIFILSLVSNFILYQS